MAYSLAAAAASQDASPALQVNGLETDIYNDVKCLRPLDQLLRCNICFDYLNVCMMTACSHNYCSFCIRKYLTYKAQCPVCFEVAAEPELRNNRLIDDVVKHYKMLRTTLQSCLRLSEDTELRIKESGSEISVKGSSEMLRDQTSKELMNLPSVSGTAITDFAEEISTESDDKEKVLCPVCSVAVLMDNINNHLDMCLTRGERRKSLRRYSGERRRSLPKVVYHFMSDKELKKRLKDFGLSVTGDRQALIKRHKSFIVLYNAECDSLHPRDVSEIIKQIEMEEKEEQALSSQQPVFQFDKRSDLEKIEVEQKKYLVQHGQQFSQLITDIRRRKSIQEEKNQNTINKQNNSTQGEVIPCSSASPPYINGDNVNESSKNVNQQTEAQKTESASVPSDKDHTLPLNSEEGKHEERNLAKKVLAPPPSPAGDSQVMLQSRKRKNKKENDHHCNKR